MKFTASLLGLMLILSTGWCQASEEKDTSQIQSPIKRFVTQKGHVFTYTDAYTGGSSKWKFGPAYIEEKTKITWQVEISPKPLTLRQAAQLCVRLGGHLPTYKELGGFANMFYEDEAQQIFSGQERKKMFWTNTYSGNYFEGNWVVCGWPNCARTDDPPPYYQSLYYVRCAKDPKDKSSQGRE